MSATLTITNSPGGPEIPVDLQTLALLLASGTPYSVAATKLGVPVSRLERIAALPQFKQVIKDIAEASGGQVAQDMIRGSGIDSVLTLIELRNDRTVNPNLRAKVAMYLIDRVYGTDKRGIGAKIDGLHEALKRVGEAGTLEDVVDQDLTRLFDQHPELLQRYMARRNSANLEISAAAVTTNTPESGQRELRPPTMVVPPK